MLVLVAMRDKPSIYFVRFLLCMHLITAFLVLSNYMNILVQQPESQRKGYAHIEHTPSEY